MFSRKMCFIKHQKKTNAHRVLVFARVLRACLSEGRLDPLRWLQSVGFDLACVVSDEREKGKYHENSFFLLERAQRLGWWLHAKDPCTKAPLYCFLFVCFLGFFFFFFFIYAHLYSVLHCLQTIWSFVFLTSFIFTWVSNFISCLFLLFLSGLDTNFF